MKNKGGATGFQYTKSSYFNQKRFNKIKIERCEKHQTQPGIHIPENITFDNHLHISCGDNVGVIRNSFTASV